MKKIILIFAIWVFSILLINKLSVGFLQDRASYELPDNLTVAARFTLLPFLNFDGRNYLEISLHGYHLDTQGRNLGAFFPLYPLAIHYGSIVTTLNPVYVGLGISFVSALLCVLLFYSLLRGESGEKNALRAVVFLLAFPTSFFLISFYSESMYLLLTLLSFWLISKKRYYGSAIIGALASAARFFGLSVAVVLFYEAVKKFNSSKKISLAFLIAPLGFCIYFVYSAIKNGNAFALTSSYQAWDRSLSLLNPVTIYIRSFMNVIGGRLAVYDSAFVYPIIVVEFLALIFITYMVFYTFKKMKDTYWVYLAFSFLIMLFIAYPSSLPRYLLPIFPIYIFLAEKLKNWQYILVVTLSFILQIFMAALFLRGYWVS